MKWTTNGPRRVLGIGLIVTAAVVAGCTPKTSANRAPVDVRGTDPNVGAQRAGQNTLNNSVVAAADANGVVTYDGYQSAIARSGDTVTTLAGRVGLSASELGSYNGLPASHQLRQGDELVLPPRPGGYGDGGGQVSVAAPNQVTDSVATNPVPQTPTIQQAPLGSGTGGTVVNPDGSIGSVPGQDLGDPVTDPVTGEITDAATSAAPATAPQPDTGWSPDLAAAAIKRSSSINDDGSLGAPPSATEPVPPEPAAREDLASPDLSQYQTGETPEPSSRTPAPADQGVGDGTQLAAASSEIRLQRPVEGPVAIGFNKGSGPARNDGVDFAAPAGSPVVAAADGEVALVSQSLGGLGTIVLVRHQNELLTVYGRIDGVLVNKGDLVSRGQQIGIVSDAASPAEPRMHFEVRRGAESLDPMLFL